MVLTRSARRRRPPREEPAAPLFSDDEAPAFDPDPPPPAATQPADGAPLLQQPAHGTVPPARYYCIPIHEPCAVSRGTLLPPPAGVGAAATGHDVCRRAAAAAAAAAGDTPPDGMARAMRAMQVYQDAKALYEASGGPGAEAGALLSAHARVAATCRDLAKDHGGVYIKAAQFVASLPTGTANAAVPVEYIAAFATL